MATACTPGCLISLSRRPAPTGESHDWSLRRVLPVMGRLLASGFAHAAVLERRRARRPPRLDQAQQLAGDRRCRHASSGCRRHPGRPAFNPRTRGNPCLVRRKRAAACPGAARRGVDRRSLPDVAGACHGKRWLPLRCCSATCRSLCCVCCATRRGASRSAACAGVLKQDAATASPPQLVEAGSAAPSASEFSSVRSIASGSGTRAAPSVSILGETG